MHLALQIPALKAGESRGTSGFAASRLCGCDRMPSVVILRGVADQRRTEARRWLAGDAVAGAYAAIANGEPRSWYAIGVSSAAVMANLWRCEPRRSNIQVR